MKTEFTDLSATRKHLEVEIPSAVVDAEIDRLARHYSRSARLPGFRPGKVPAHLVRQRYRDQILHDVAHDLIPKAVDEALRERGLEPVDTPSITDVTVEEGRPLTFTASFETLPPVDPGDYTGLTVRRTIAAVSEEDVRTALERLRLRAARHEPVVGRGAAPGDTALVDLDRRVASRPDRAEPGAALRAPSLSEGDRHENVSIELGGPANPPGFDDHLLGIAGGDTRTFTVRFPADYAVPDLAGADVEYTVAVKAVRQRILPALDDEFARDLGSFDTLEALRDRVRADLETQAARDADRRMRSDLVRQLAARVTGDVPDALVTRDLDRRVEHFAQHLVAQGVDPRTAEIDWPAFREDQRAAAAESVRGTLVLDEIARRESIGVDEADLARALERYAGETDRTVAAVRATLEKEGGVARLAAGLRRDKTIDFLLSRATMIEV